MGRRKRFFRPGFLIIFLVFFSRAGFSEDIELRIGSSPANPTVNNPWVFYIHANHPNPLELNVNAPAFPGSLALERIRTEPRLIEGERWTRIEFLFTPLRPGIVRLGPFELTVPASAAAVERKALLEEISVRILPGAAAVRLQPQFRWIPSPAAAAVRPGERLELLLELSNWDPQRNPPLGIFQGRAPVNAILAESLDTAIGQSLHRYTISVLALEEGRITLEPFSFNWDTYTLNVPGINVQVLPALPRPAEISIEIPDEPDEFYISHLPFPEIHKNIFRPFRAEYERIISSVRALWDEKRFAEAMAEIRRYERDSLLRSHLAPLRSEMEQALGLRFTQSETWRPLRVSLFSWFVIIFMVFYGLYIALTRRRQVHSVTFRRQRCFRIIAIFLVCTILAITGSIRQPAKHGVLHRTHAFRIPDTAAAANFWFDTGQPVTITDDHLEWCYAVAPDGRSGWIRRDALIIY